MFFKEIINFVQACRLPAEIVLRWIHVPKCGWSILVKICEFCSKGLIICYALRLIHCALIRNRITTLSISTHVTCLLLILAIRKRLHISRSNGISARIIHFVHRIIFLERLLGIHLFHSLFFDLLNRLSDIVLMRFFFYLRHVLCFARQRLGCKKWMIESFMNRYSPIRIDL